jgi:hypothetical protein
MTTVEHGPGKLPRCGSPNAAARASDNGDPASVDNLMRVVYRDGWG